MLAARLLSLEKAARATALEMEFDFLLDKDRKLLSIGYLASEDTFDPTAMICSPRRRGSQAFWQSQKMTFQRSTGFDSVAPYIRRRVRRRADFVVGVNV